VVLYENIYLTLNTIISGEFNIAIL